MPPTADTMTNSENVEAGVPVEESAEDDHAKQVVHATLLTSPKGGNEAKKVALDDKYVEDIEAGVIAAEGSPTVLPNDDQDFEDVTTQAEPCDHETLGLEEKKEETDAAEAAPRRRCGCTRMRKFQCCALFIAAIVGLCVLLRPRDPSWHLTHLEIDTGLFLGAMLSGVGTSEPMGFWAKVDVYNPNLLGTTTDEGTFIIYYHGEEIGHGTVSPAKVRPRATTNLHVNVVADFSGEVADKMMNELGATDYRLDVHVDVRTKAKVGFFKITSLVSCDVHSKSDRLIEDPAGILESKDCTYGYEL